MYAVIQLPNRNYLPSIVNMNDRSYPDLIMSGYEIIETGSKKEMMSLMDEMIMEFANVLD